MSTNPDGIVKIAIAIIVIIVAVMAVILIHNHKSSESTETPGVLINQSNPSGNTTVPDKVNQSSGTNDRVPSSSGTGQGSSNSLLGPSENQ